MDYRSRCGALTSRGQLPLIVRGLILIFPIVVLASFRPTSTTSTLAPTPTATTSPPIADQFVYLPFVQKQIVVPGSLSIDAAYTSTYDDNLQTTFQPCQAVALSVRMRNAAGVSQTAILHWQTWSSGGEAQANLGARRQVNVPPGESTWRFLGAPDLDAPAGEYRFGVWFTSGTDREDFEGVLTVEGPPVPTRYLEGMTAKIDPRNYELILPRTIVPRKVYANYPVRRTDTFTADDEFVIQSTLWEGVGPDSVILTRRYRPDDRRWGNAYYAFRDYDIQPGCVRRQNLYWHVDDMEWMPGQWRLEFSADTGETWQGELLFTLTE